MLNVLRESIEKLNTDKTSILSEMANDSYGEDDFMEVAVDTMTDGEKKKLEGIIDKAIPEDTCENDTLTPKDIEDAAALMHDPTIEELADEMM